VLKKIDSIATDGNRFDCFLEGQVKFGYTLAVKKPNFIFGQRNLLNNGSALDRFIAPG
jgi:hypothetical protein